MRVVITGANRGIGHELMKVMQASGADVVGTARDIEGYLPLDVTDPNSVRTFATRIGPDPVDALVCNAGVYFDKHESLENGYPADMWADTFAVNVTGVFLTVQALLPNLRKSSAGKIAIISSTMASQERAPGGSYIYRASKAAALNLGRNLAKDLAKDTISVGIYHPGWVITDMGGSDADIEVDEAALGLKDRINDLSMAKTGCFENWDGSQHVF
jgi:NAD(P)-dependent dehydrogenase (short-subunit alcohol dehydrogenase family)